MRVRVKKEKKVGTVCILSRLLEVTIWFPRAWVWILKSEKIYSLSHTHRGRRRWSELGRSSSTPTSSTSPSARASKRSLSLELCSLNQLTNQFQTKPNSDVKLTSKRCFLKILLDLSEIVSKYLNLCAFWFQTAQNEERERDLRFYVHFFCWVFGL